MALEANMPNSKDIHNLGSPVSPLCTASASHTSSSASSFGSLSRNPHPNAASTAVATSGRHRHCGELFVLSKMCLVATDSRLERPGHCQTGSSPLIYFGGGCTASSAVTNVLIAGNNCPLAKIMAQSSAWSDVFCSATGNYGTEA